MDFPPTREPVADEISPDATDEALKEILAAGLVVPLPMTEDAESMLPTLHPGQRVAVERAGDRPERGDLLLFRQVNFRVVHRYLGPATQADGAPCLRTRGDNNPTLDAPLDSSRVLGRVIAVERDGAWWDLDDGLARLYGLGVSLHLLFWAFAAHVADKLDRSRGRSDGRLRRRIGNCDRRLLALAHQFFLRLARRRESPRGPSSGAGPRPVPRAAGPR